jgi:hypothetical protein
MKLKARSIVIAFNKKISAGKTFKQEDKEDLSNSKKFANIFFYLCNAYDIYIAEKLSIKKMLKSLKSKILYCIFS